MRSQPINERIKRVIENNKGRLFARIAWKRGGK